MYSILILPIAAGLIAQLIKFFIKSNHNKWTIKNILAYSGMPSGHTAMVVSLSTIIGLELGLSSPIFAISVVFAIIIIRDALGLRRYLGQHGRILNILVKDLKDDKVLDEKYPHLLEQIGHTFSQVLVGAMIGFLVSLLGFYLI
ncbi:MAG: divergent PAP2 family protein [Patescibacteria group bacterium]